MTWIDATDFERRPLVFVEDHLYHTTELVDRLAAVRPDLIAHTTVCTLDREGPDTSATVHDWLARHPRLHVAAQTAAAPGISPLTAADLVDPAAYARFVARLLRPGGLLVQDVQLSTLPFVPADRWWESIYLAATVRGMFPVQPPIVRFLSNKRGYTATFGRDLVEAGFDPRDVMDKSELADVVVPTIATLVDRAFPLVLHLAGRRVRVAAHEAERRELEQALDLVLWHTADGVELGGRLIDEGRTDRRVSLRVNSHETQTWQALLTDRLAGGPGLPVVLVGERVGPKDADRAELTNLAARHIHSLRQRLSDPGAIVTADHAYRLSDRVRVGTTRPLH